AGAHRQLAHGEPAELKQILLLEVLRLTGADHDQTGDLQSLRHDQLERRTALAGEAFGLGGARHQPGSRAQGLRRSGAEFERVVAEHDQDAGCADSGGSGKRSKSELQGIGHRLNPDLNLGTNLGTSADSPIWTAVTLSAKPQITRFPGFSAPRATGWAKGRALAGDSLVRQGAPMHLAGPADFTFCCACSTALPLRGHFVDGSRYT